MKLLNLWPQEVTSAQPQARLWSEIVFALLVVCALVLSVWFWLDGCLRNTSQAHQILKNESVQLHQSRSLQITSAAQMPQVMRQLQVGELDWMGQLPQWLMGQRIQWVSAKYDQNGLKLVGVARDADAINAMLEQVKAQYPKPPVQVREIANVRLAGQTLWRFEMSLASNSAPAISAANASAPTTATQEGQEP